MQHTIILCKIFGVKHIMLFGCSMHLLQNFLGECLSDLQWWGAVCVRQSVWKVSGSYGCSLEY